MINSNVNYRCHKSTIRTFKPLANSSDDLLDPLNVTESKNIESLNPFPEWPNQEVLLMNKHLHFKTLEELADERDREAQQAFEFTQIQCEYA